MRVLAVLESPLPSQSLNVNSAVLLSPERVALAGVLAYLGVFLVAPVVAVHPISWGALGFVGACYAAFFAGSLAIPRRRGEPVPPAVAWRFSRAVFWLFLCIGVLGIALRAYDKYVLRGVNLDEGALEGRSLLAEAGAGPIAVVAGVLFPFCYVPLILWWAQPNQRRGWISGALALVAFLMPAADALLILSRSPLLVTAGLALAAASCVLYRGRVINKPLLRFGAIAVALLTALSVYIFEVRLREMNLDVAASILMSAYGDTLAPSQAAMDAMSDPEGGAGFLALLPMLQYYLHGVFEFGVLWERPEPQAFAMGFQHLAPYVKALNILGVLEYPDIGHNLYVRDGVFTSFFGPLWTDFGWFGVTFMFFFGLACKLCSRLAWRGHVGVLPLYAYLCVILFFMPVVNFWVSAQGSYLINAFLLVWLSSLVWAKRARVDPPLLKSGRLPDPSILH